MPPADTTELKKILRGAGFEIYRTTAQLVHLAERVRDNLIMDSGVAAQLTGTAEMQVFSVQVNLRAQASHFPGAAEDQVWNHARSLAQGFFDSGYIEDGSRAEPMIDPSDPSQSLDTSYEILLTRTVPDLDALHEELRAALNRRRSTSDD